eukprot:TRINITY_DN36755_c0_g1_i1.p1 TRINITY_DN36755_c0_g1~~TRINITY_DN36755_c0_g1_i1.p1  ORF type:complete len:459 (+),score=80.22 TRINITY_DN36755_c0_g1_i1:41-1417(+)
MNVAQPEVGDESLKAKIVDHLKPLVLDQDLINRLRQAFETEVENGLEHGLKKSSIQMENTYIYELLDGSENGKVLALDLGGTNFRVIQLTLENGRITNEILDYYSVRDELRHGPGTDLFDFLAESIKDFCVKHSVDLSVPISLGFTFSFPMIQHALDVGILVNWTKSFSCPGVIGEDAVKLLNNSLNKIGLENVKVVAILNDATGTLVAGVHDYPDTGISVLLSTGSNGAYLEKVQRIKRWESGSKEGLEYVVVDPEWGAFGDNGSIDFIKTEWDRILDDNSLLPKSFTFEKYYAGKYMGELVRIVLRSLFEKEILTECPEEIKITDSISTLDASKVSQDILDGKDTNTKQILERLGCPVNQVMISVLQYIVELLTERASVLVAVPMAFFLDRIDRPMTTIAASGSMYKHHPSLKDKITSKIEMMTDKKFKFGLSDDGSGRGAGLVAAIAQRLAAKKK